MSNQKTCPDCQGDGVVLDYSKPHVVDKGKASEHTEYATKTCPRCKGSGEVES